MISLNPTTALRRAIQAIRASCAGTLWMATQLFGGLGVAAQAVEAPTALASVASATPQLKTPPAEPQKLVLQAATNAPGSPPGPATARGEGKVAAGRPIPFVFRPETTGLYSIGVSSPQSAARIAIYLGDSTKPEAGTAPADGAIRWSSEIAAGASVKVVVHTAGGEIPFRVEASAGPGGL